MGKKITIGLIAEDDSDIESLQVMIRRIKQGRKGISFKSFVGNGCGKITRKCFGWADNLKKRGCRALIIVHDLDNKILEKLYDTIKDSISPCPIANYLICVPIQEIEAWLLSDPVAIQKTFKLNKAPNISHNPETINSPKEYLGVIVDRFSDGYKPYINTKHNSEITKHIDINKVLKCSSFKPFHKFVINNI